jgi:hypothetical protein
VSSSETWEEVVGEKFWEKICTIHFSFLIWTRTIQFGRIPFDWLELARDLFPFKTGDHIFDRAKYMERDNS